MMMVRFALLLLVCVPLVDSAHAGWLDDLKAKAAAERAAMIKANKIPPVRLSQKQTAQLPGAKNEGSKIVWVGAGRQKDGKIFVCHVSIGKKRGYVSLLAGTLEADGSYQRTTGSKEGTLRACWEHGFEPPVTIRRRFY
jgi:hypothetical protein